MPLAFTQEDFLVGYGGAISAENVANVTVEESFFDKCKASYGGSISVGTESILKLDHSKFAGSYAIKKGGGIHIFQYSFAAIQSTNVTDGKST